MSVGGRSAPLGDTLSKLEHRFGELAAELAELDDFLAPFLDRYRRDVLAPQEALVNLRRRVADARLLLGDRAAREAAEADTPLGRLLVNEAYPSVREQYERVWKGKQQPRAEDAFVEFRPAPLAPEVLALYTRVAAQLHPLLADDRAERERRKGLMAPVDWAYVRRDVISLHSVADAHARESSLPALAGPEADGAMQQRISQLEKGIQRAESRIYERRHGDAAKVLAYTLAAGRSGLDMLGELNRMTVELIDAAERELSGLEARLKG